MERGLKIALRDSKGEELEQVKAEIARFWREWGGEYKRLHSELVTERTQGEALRNIRPLIPDSALTPEINQLLDQMERELDQRPVTDNDITQWINRKDTNKATRDRQPTTSREQLTETARETTQSADNFETMPEVEKRIIPDSFKSNTPSFEGMTEASVTRRSRSYRLKSLKTVKLRRDGTISEFKSDDGHADDPTRNARWWISANLPRTLHRITDICYSM